VDVCTPLIYGMGSLYTSIVPSLILEGVGEAIAARSGPKVGRCRLTLSIPR